MLDANCCALVIGSGPAAHTAAVYLGRAELKRMFDHGFREDACVVLLTDADFHSRPL